MVHSRCTVSVPEYLMNFTSTRATPTLSETSKDTVTCYRRGRYRNPHQSQSMPTSRWTFEICGGVSSMPVASGHSSSPRRDRPLKSYGLPPLVGQNRNHAFRWSWDRPVIALRGPRFLGTGRTACSLLDSNRVIRLPRRRLLLAQLAVILEQTVSRDSGVAPHPLRRVPTYRETVVFWRSAPAHAGGKGDPAMGQR